MRKRLLYLALSGGLLLSFAGPAHATTPTQKVSNVQISAAGLNGGELEVTWTVPESHTDVATYTFVSYVAVIKNSSGAEILSAPVINPTTTAAQTFTGLVNGELYTAEVRTNYSPSSSLVTLTTIGGGSARPYAAPSAPAKPTVSRSGAGEIFVDWDAPANNGNAISGYTIACVPSCSSSTLTSTDSQTTIVGLNTSTSYTVTVVATNERGSSTASVSSDAVTPHAAVVAPSNLTVTPGDAQLAASWTAPTISGAIVSSYSAQVFAESAPSTVVQTKSTTTTSTTFTGLTNGVRYFYKVSTVVGSITSAPATSLGGLTAAAVVPAPPAPAPNPPSQINTPSSSGTSTASTPADAPAPAAQPTSKVKQRTAGASLATQIGMTVTPKAKVKLTVAKASKKICKVSGGRLVALKPGNCSVTVAVTPAKTKAVKKPKTTKQSTVVAIS